MAGNENQAPNRSLHCTKLSANKDSSKRKGCQKLSGSTVHVWTPQLLPYKDSLFEWRNGACSLVLSWFVVLILKQQYQAILILK